MGNRFTRLVSLDPTFWAKLGFGADQITTVDIVGTDLPFYGSAPRDNLMMTAVNAYRETAIFDTAQAVYVTATQPNVRIEGRVRISSPKTNALGLVDEIDRLIGALQRQRGIVISGYPPGYRALKKRGGKKPVFPISVGDLTNAGQLVLRLNGNRDLLKIINVRFTLLTGLSLTREEIKVASIDHLTTYTFARPLLSFTRPLGIFITEGGNREVVLNTDNESISIGTRSICHVITSEGREKSLANFIDKTTTLDSLRLGIEFLGPITGITEAEFNVSCIFEIKHN